MIANHSGKFFLNLRTALASTLIIAALFLPGQNTALAAAFTGGNIVVYRVGDGTSALSGAAAPIFLDEYTTAGTLVQTIALPTTTSGANRRITNSGSATSEGLMTLSADKQYLLLAGYDAAVATAAVSGTTAAAVNRVIARIGANGIADTTTALTDAATGNSPRGVASNDGNALWIGGGAGGVRYTTLGATTSTQLSTTSTNIRGVSVIAGQLYVSSSSGAIRAATVGSGLPTTAGQTITNLPGFPVTGSPHQFFFADLDPGVSGVDTLYIADDTGAANIQKYSFDGTTWTARGSATLSSARGLTGVVTGSTVTLYVTNGLSIQTLTDSSGFNGIMTATAANLATSATAGANRAFRGIAFAPVPLNQPDLIVATAAPASATAGSNYTYSITVNNSGLANATGVTTTFAIPAGTTYVSSSIGSSNFSAAQAGGIVTFSGGTVNIATPAVLTVTVTAPAVATTVTSATTDTAVDPANTIAESNETNNNSPAAVATVITIGLQPDLTIMRTGPATALTNSTITYTITVSNGGAATANGVNATFTLPAGVTYSAANVGATGFTATQLGGVVTFAGGTVTTVTPAAFTVDVIAPATAGTVTSAASTAVVDPANTVAESVETNNADATIVTTTISVPPTPDLTVALTAPTVAFISGNFDYTLSVANIGTGNATNVAVRFTLPAGLNFVSAAIGTTNFTSSQAAGVVTFAGGTVNTGSPQILTVTVQAPVAATTVTAGIGAAQADPANVIAELNETNNLSASVITAINGVTLISAVQGSGNASPLVGTQVLVEGIVTGVFQGANSLNGFYVQEEDADADTNPLTSEGVFVFTGVSPASVAVGDKVRVSGNVIEFGTAPNTLTEISAPTVTVISSGNPLPTAVDVALPVATLGDLERYEGMLVRFTQSLTVSDNFSLARFGEVTLSVNGRSLQPTNEVDPNDNPAAGTNSSGNSNAANVSAFADLNARSRILLDDASSRTFSPTILFADPATGSLRLGSTVANLTGILSQSFGVHRVYATTPPAFAYAPRPATPPAVGGNVKVASMNVLNYFNGDGLGAGFPTARGADSLLEFNRQRAKVIAALLGLNADVVGLLEIENDGAGANSAIQDLVNGLNTVAGAGAWALISDPVGWGTFPGSTDAIKPTFVYRTAAVAPVGLPTSPSDVAFNNARAPIAQTFRLLYNNEIFIAVINHFKSKNPGGTGLDADQGDGQGEFNNARKLQAAVLVSFITTLTPTTPRVIAMGDFNAYEQEDPIDVLRAGGLATIINNSYSYMFNGLSGSLDHALGTPALMSVITGAGKWHINADEPTYLDYNVETKNTLGCTGTCTTPDFYAATPFRASDHDPVLVGLQLNGAQCVAGSFSADGFAPCVLASAGSFVAVNGATAQTLCAAGSFSATSGATACTLAALGFFVPVTGATAQTACAVGTTTLVTGATVCVPITFIVTPSAGANGTITPNTAQTVAFNTTTTFTITANAGFSTTVASGAGACGGTLLGVTYTTAAITNNCNVSATFTALPVQCLAGTFSATGNAPCTPASPGSFVATVGAMSQTLCAVGTFSAAAGALACTVATAGNYVALTGATAQTPASAGSFVSAVGASAQTFCAAGAFSAATGTTACTLAAPGFFVPTSGATAQSACAAGTTTLVSGATACIAITYSVTPSAGANGTITPNTAQTVTSGATTIFAVSPNAGFTASVTTGAGNCGGALLGTTYTTAPITANCNVGVTFVAVVPVPQTITGFAPASPVRVGALPVALAASGGASGNAVVFATTSAATVCTVAGTVVSFTGVGSCNLTANQAAAVGFAAAPQVTATIVVNQGTQSIAFNPPPNVPLSAASLPLNATASSGLAVNYVSSTPGVCTVAGSIVTLASAGTCSVTASQAGNANYQAALSVTQSFVITIASGSALTSSASIARFGEILTLTFSVAGNTPSGTVAFSTSGGAPIPGCAASPLTSGVATCLVPSRFTTQNPLAFSASYSGDARNAAASVFLPQTVQYDLAVLSTSVEPVNAVAAASRVTVTALVRMRSPVGSVTFYPGNPVGINPVAIPGCAAIPIAILPNATDSAVATCSITAPQSGSAQVVAVYNYPAGHISNRIFEQEIQTVATITNAPTNYTDMWWGGIRENGWGVSITQHGATQVNVIYTYDNVGKPLWYFMSGCTVNAATNTCTGNLYQPTSSPFFQYDVTRFAVNASVGTATFAFKSASTATMSYTINGISGSKEIEREIFANPTSGPNLAVNDLWWNGLAENGWGMNIAQQGRQLFPVWYTYDANGKNTFYAVPGGTWSGLVFTGDIYTTTSSAWLGVPYDASKFLATKVGTMVIDYRDANTATVTYTVGNVTQTKLITRQGF